MTPFWTSRDGLVETYVGDALAVLRKWDCLRDTIETNEPNGMIPIYTLISNAYAQADTPLVVTDAVV